MLELLSGGILGSLIGGIFRLAPEVLKWLDKKNERQHELAMFDRQCDLELQRGQIKIGEIEARHEMAVDTGVIEAFRATIDQQAEMVKAAGGWAATVSASVRPVMTYYLLALYGLAKVAAMIMAMWNGEPALHVLARCWNPEDMALLCGVVNYWIMDRTLMRRGL